MKIKKLIIFLLLGFFILILFSIFIKESLNPKNNIKNNKKIFVTASFYPLSYIASQIGGNKVDVENITPPGAEPHDYELSTQQVAHIENSDMLILNGAGFETWGENIKENLSKKNILIITTATTLINETKDPHIWLSPPLFKKEAKIILEGLVKIDPKNKTYYENNAFNLINQLNQLDKEYREGLSNCKQKYIVTSHSAFAYLAKTYGLNQITITGISPDEEPSVQRLIEIAQFAKKNNIKYIFFERLISPKLTETIAHEIGAQTLVLDPIEGISDNDAKNGKNYLTIMKENLTNLKKALECQ